MPCRAYILPLVLLGAALLSQLAVTGAGVAAKVDGRTYHATMWPFVDYPMYSKSSGPPVRTTTVQLLARLDDRSKVVIDEAFMGLNHFAWRYHVVERLVAEPPADPDADPALTALIEEHRDAALGRVWNRVVVETGHPPTDLTVYRTVHTLSGRRIDTEELTQPVDLARQLDRLDHRAQEAADGD